MTMKSLILMLFAVSASFTALSCGGEGEPADGPATDTTAALDSVPPVTPETRVDDRPLQEGFIRARHILVSWDGCGIQGVTRSREEAAQLIGQIQEQIASGEATFEELAYAWSDCTTAPDSGMLPDFSRGAMIPEFENAAFDLDSGQVSGVVETDFGFHLIKRVR
jgi:hypothetical protein